jgi:hypothetical protein
MEANTAATAASKALPPSQITSSPAATDNGCPAEITFFEAIHKYYLFRAVDAGGRVESSRERCGNRIR